MNVRTVSTASRASWADTVCSRYGHPCFVLPSVVCSCDHNQPYMMGGYGGMGGMYGGGMGGYGMGGYGGMGCGCQACLLPGALLIFKCCAPEPVQMAAW